jgi:hypothetical protein
MRVSHRTYRLAYKFLKYKYIEYLDKVIRIIKITNKRKVRKKESDIGLEAWKKWAQPDWEDRYRNRVASPEDILTCRRKFIYYITLYRKRIEYYTGCRCSKCRRRRKYYNRTKAGRRDREIAKYELKSGDSI